MGLKVGFFPSRDSDGPVLIRVFALGNGFYCIDVNECYQRDTCPDSVSSCVNSEGSFQCECIDGYAKGKVIRELN